MGTQTSEQSSSQPSPVYCPPTGNYLPQNPPPQLGEVVPPESVQSQSWPPPSPSPGPPKTFSYSSHCLRPKPVFQEQKHIGTIKRTWNEPQRNISITSSSTCFVTILKEHICHQDKLKRKPHLLVSSAVCGNFLLVTMFINLKIYIYIKVNSQRKVKKQMG